jgi:hypothetical protein
MPAAISSNHPLRGLFRALVERSLERHLRRDTAPLARYLGDVLVDFTHRDHLTRIRNAAGRPLEQVGEMLAEGDVALNATSFERERAVHKHIGDYTLFWTGVYPEMLRLLRHAQRMDHLLDYVEQGRRSYHIASTFRHEPYAEEAQVLGTLSEEFEACVVALHGVRRELDACGGAQARVVRRLLGE